ncbi:MAG: FIST C-terminal domain-containing protein, partial [Thermoplasmata archaeon]|nr:FIST C-terminal domain-containing protein [Thermoplasmata archaeon]
MQLETTSWTPGVGWSTPLPSGLDSDHTLVLAFGDRQLEPSWEPIPDLRSAFPMAHIIGCSTAGQILDDTVTDGTLVVSIAEFASTRIAETATSISGPTDSFGAGERIAAALNAPDLRAVFVLSDGLAVNGSELVRGIESGIPSGTLITGGLAGDGDRFERTWVLSQDGPRAGNVTAIGLLGDEVVVGSGSFGGWDPFGPERLVTRSKGNVLYELDGQPALTLYKEYLGDRADGLPATALLFPLAVRATSEGPHRTVRTILAVDEADQSMTFAGDVPE